MKRSPIFMNAAVFWLVLGVSAVYFAVLPDRQGFAQEKGTAVAEAIKLPAPRTDGGMSVERALSERRSIRSYKEDSLTLQDLSQLLWAAQGITEPKRGLRTAPSPMARYLLSTYVLPGNVAGLPKGMYRYEPKGHSLLKMSRDDKKTELSNAVGQAPMKGAAVLIVFSGMSERSGRPGWMYLEAGAASENLFLQAVAMGLGTVTIGGFKDEDVRRALGFGPAEQPIYIMPVGKK